MGDCQIVGASVPPVTVNPAPVSVEPATASAVIAWAPAPDSPYPSGAAAVHPLVPGPDVQMTTSWSPGVPNVPVAVYPCPAAASAVTVSEAGPETGEGSADSCHVAPPSPEIAPNGISPPAPVTALPTAATVPPAAATYRRDAARADAGSGSVTWRQALPLAEIHAAGLAPAEPAATK